MLIKSFSHRSNAELIRQRLSVDVFRGIENDQHGSATNFAVVIVFGRHLRFRRDSDFECFKTGRAGDGVGVHVSDWCRVSSDQCLLYRWRR